ncbi:MAG: acyl-CoA/acyl-ACP dehydrogenase [Bacteroidales bacterium]|nr:acyl-CoA/acyl-ACP dehydrogenase [Bacteroidales bacterium]
MRDLKTKMDLVFHERADIEKMGIKRGLPPFVLRELMSVNPLSISIKKEYGGRGAYTHEVLELLATTSYESLALSLTLGINSALFLQPLAKYGQEEVKAPVFKKFLEEKTMGGLMITEPDFGSDALNMQTSHTEKNGKYQLKGTKHWAGLTGWAEYWLITARQQTDSGNLQRDIDFFLVDINKNGQQIEVEEVFENLGLYAIPYGRNRIDLEVPATHKLQPHTTGIKMMLDLLHSSRMQFPGMGMGFIKRMLDEAIEHCKQRFVGGQNLLSYDQVQRRISKLQASYTVCTAMCVNSSEKLNADRDMAPHGLEANAVKSVITDLMQEAAQSAMQLIGAKSYKLNHVVGRATVDSRPFQIFEGSNDILYAQITEGLMKLMKRTKEINLFRFLKEYNLTSHAVDYVKNLMNFNLNMEMPQRKSVELGKVIGRIISMNQVLDLSQKGFRKDLIEGAITMLQQDVSKLMAGFSFKAKSMVIEDYEENSKWLNFANI